MQKLRVKKLSTFLEKTRGLMFSESSSAVYLETRFGIHTFFLRDPIKIVILDRDFIIRVINRDLKPGRIFFWNPKYFRVIEFPTKTKLPKGIEIGKTLFVEFGVK